MNNTRWTGAAALLVLLTACGGPTRPTPGPESVPNAIPREEPRSRSGNPQFYEVFGKRYFVMPSSAGYVERGVASWDGPGFHGNSTASGERYDMDAMTAAHKTLPLPCYVQVTNLANGRSIVVRVNDRGPFVDNRLIDLSRSAAARLDLISAGTGLVEVRAINAATTTPAVASRPAPNADKTLYIQVGAFSEQTNADRLTQRLRTAGIAPISVRGDQVNGRTLYRVRVGPVPSVEEFDRLIQSLRRAGIPDAHLALD